MATVPLRTAAWYGDAPCTLVFPDEWQVSVHWPEASRPLTDEHIAAALDCPVGQPPVRELCRGARRPVIVIDDLKRPTPVDRVLPPLLRHFADAGIAASSITVVMATGTHGPGPTDAAARKLGAELAARCRVVVHNPDRDLVHLGRTSFGTPVKINREVAQADFLVGIGGIYPNHTAGFGGGSKLVLGVLGFSSIARLHATHRAAGWGAAAPACTFRGDLNEIAGMARLHTIVSMQVNADREPVRIVSGDHFRYYAEEVAFARRLFATPAPDGEDVLVCNAYPNDISLTFAHMKGIGPLQTCGPGASRIAVAACPEGLGTHGLYPRVSGTQLARARRLGRRAMAMGPGQLCRAVLHRLARHGARADQPISRRPIWLYRPGEPDLLPRSIAGVRLARTWAEVIAAVRREHPGSTHLRVSVYPCAPIQFLQAGAGTESSAQLTETA